jgi:hypothetical protein
MGETINTDFDNLEKIISVVCYPSPSLTVKHIVTLIRKIPAKNNKKEEERGYAFYYSLNKGNSTGLYLESRSSILLEGHRNTLNNEGVTNYKKISCSIDMKDVSNFLNRLDVAYNWLVGEQNKQIYLADVQGRPCKILDLTKKVVVSLSQSTYVAFKPCIIRDMSDVTYEGIAMGNEQGEITNFTASEYSSFRVQMQGLLPNLYLANNTLINNAIQLSIYNKLKISNKNSLGG